MLANKDRKKPKGSLKGAQLPRLLVTTEKRSTNSHEITRTKPVIRENSCDLVDRLPTASPLLELMRQLTARTESGVGEPGKAGKGLLGR